MLQWSHQSLLHQPNIPQHPAALLLPECRTDLTLAIWGDQDRYYLGASSHYLGFKSLPPLYLLAVKFKKFSLVKVKITLSRKFSLWFSVFTWNGLSEDLMTKITLIVEISYHPSRVVFSDLRTHCCSTVLLQLDLIIDIIFYNYWQYPNISAQHNVGKIQIQPAINQNASKY